MLPTLGNRLPGSCLKAFQFSVKAVLKCTNIYDKSGGERKTPRQILLFTLPKNVRYSNNGRVKEVVIFWRKRWYKQFSVHFSSVEIKVKRFVYMSSVKNIAYLQEYRPSMRKYTHTFFFHKVSSPQTVVIESEMRFRLLCCILRTDTNGLSLGCWRPLAKKDKAFELR